MPSSFALSIDVRALRQGVSNELRNILRTTVLLFLCIQGCEVLLDVPLGVIQQAPSYLKSLSAGELFVNWIVPAIIISALYAVVAFVFALLLRISAIISVAREHLSCRIVLHVILFVFLAAVIYDIYLLGFPTLALHIFRAGNLAITSLLIALALTLGAWRYADLDALKSRLRRAGTFYTFALLVLAAVPLFGGVRLVNPESLSRQATAVVPRTVRPNIIVVIADALSANAMSLHGDPYLTTPQLEHLSTSGTVVTGLTAVSNWTAPTMATLLSGVEPSTHGVFAEASRLQDDRHFSKAQVLPAELQKAGYETVAVVQNGLGYPLHLGVEATFNEAPLKLSACDPVAAIRSRFRGRGSRFYRADVQLGISLGQALDRNKMQQDEGNRHAA